MTIGSLQMNYWFTFWLLFLVPFVDEVEDFNNTLVNLITMNQLSH